jgi:adenine-specific DNA-methyltransferase
VATGITKGEQIGKNAIVASTHAVEPDPLPPEGCSVSIVYPNKIDEREVLRGYDASFVAIDSEGSEYDRDVIEPNALVVCNNIYGLGKALETNAGKVKLIYTDPPYGTGMGFHSRDLAHAYDDHMDEANYMEFIRRRLILCRELLADEGSIYLHIGHHMVAELKLVMDEVFGRSNFRNLIARRKCSSKNSTRNSYPNLLDFVLFYSKSKNYEFNQPTEEPSEEWLLREYPKQDKKGRYKLVPVHAPGTRNGATGSEWRGMLPPPGKHWQYTPARLDELDANGEMHWSKNGNPRRKVYLEANKGLPMTDYWGGYRDAHHQSIAISGYPTEKNFDMVKKIIAAGSSEGDLVMDPFCGSGTTMHAADDLGRKWIGFDQSLTAADAAVSRLRRGLSKMGDYLDRGDRERDLFGSTLRSFQLLFDKELLMAYPDEIQRISTITRVCP